MCVNAREWGAHTSPHHTTRTHTLPLSLLMVLAEEVGRSLHA